MGLLDYARIAAVICPLICYGVIRVTEKGEKRHPLSRPLMVAAVIIFGLFVLNGLNSSFDNMREVMAKEAHPTPWYMIGL